MFVMSDISQKLNLQGKTQQISLNSTLVAFEIFSPSNSTSVNVKNAWIVDSMKLPSQHINTGKLKNCYNHLAGIQYTPFNKSSEISVLIGADNLMLHMYTNVHIGKEKKTHSLKNETRLGIIWFK